MSYSGWSNYETWNLALWIDNDEGTYNYWRERAREIYKDAEADKTFTRKENAVFELAEALESETRDNAPEVEGFYGDILTMAIKEVNFHEIAEHWIEDIAEDLDDEETAERITSDN